MTHKKKLILIAHMLVAGFITAKMYLALIDTLDLPTMWPFFKYLFAGLVSVMGFTVNAIAYIDELRHNNH
jgi:hypothetical protein